MAPKMEITGAEPQYTCLAGHGPNLNEVRFMNNTDETLFPRSLEGRVYCGKCIAEWCAVSADPEMMKLEENTPA